MKIRRTLPPVGYRLPVSMLLSSLRRAGSSTAYRKTVFEPQIAKHFDVPYACAVSSGKAALTVILQALQKLSRRRKVIIPAYTCYSVPSAIIKAGLEVVPCDIRNGSFDYDYEQLIPMLQPDVLCVLSVHLLGIPSDTARLKALCRDTGIFVVEDAAQAMGGLKNGTYLGTQGDAGFFSLGRGKNVTCGSGGVILSKSESVAGAVSTVAAALPAPTPAQSLSTFVTLLLLQGFISPRLYWFPAGLPFLKLGETIYHEEFPMRSLSDFQALLLRDWPERLAALDAVRRFNSAYYLARLTGARSYGDDVPYLRFPFVLPGSADKQHVLIERQGVALGMSGMYPGSVAGIPQLHHRLSGSRFPEAERISASLVTLPTHPLVSDEERIALVSLVNGAVAQTVGPIDMQIEEPVTHAPVRL